MASGSLKVLVISAVQTRKLQVSGGCTLSVVVRPFHLEMKHLSERHNPDSAFSD